MAGAAPRTTAAQEHAAAEEAVAARSGVAGRLAASAKRAWASPRSMYARVDDRSQACTAQVKMPRPARTICADARPGLHGVQSPQAMRRAHQRPASPRVPRRRRPRPALSVTSAASRRPPRRAARWRAHSAARIVTVSGRRAGRGGHRGHGRRARRADRPGAATRSRRGGSAGAASRRRHRRTAARGRSSRPPAPAHRGRGEWRRRGAEAARPGAAGRRGRGSGCRATPPGSSRWTSGSSCGGPPSGPITSVPGISSGRTFRITSPSRPGRPRWRLARSTFLPFTNTPLALPVSRMVMPVRAPPPAPRGGASTWRRSRRGRRRDRGRGPRRCPGARPRGTGPAGSRTSNRKRASVRARCSASASGFWHGRGFGSHESLRARSRLGGPRQGVASRRMITSDRAATRGAAGRGHGDPGRRRGRRGPRAAAGLRARGLRGDARPGGPRAAPRRRWPRGSRTSSASWSARCRRATQLYKGLPGIHVGRAQPGRGGLGPGGPGDGLPAGDHDRRDAHRRTRPSSSRA